MSLGAMAMALGHLDPPLAKNLLKTSVADTDLLTDNVYTSHF